MYHRSDGNSSLETDARRGHCGAGGADLRDLSYPGKGVELKIGCVIDDQVSWFSQGDTYWTCFGAWIGGVVLPPSG